MFEKALAMDPSQSESAEWIGYIYQLTSQSQKGIEFLSSYILQHPDNCLANKLAHLYW
jgi:hypothetical protein